MAIVEYKKKNIMRLRFHDKEKGEQHRVLLVPGNNIVNDDLWDLAVQHPTVQKLIEADHIDVCEQDFKDLSDMAAIKLVNKTNDASVLELWKSEEKRERVKTKITERLKAIEDFVKNKEKKAKKEKE